MRQADELFAYYFHSGTQAKLLVDSAKGSIILANECACNLLELPADEIAAKPLSEFLVLSGNEEDFAKEILRREGIVEVRSGMGAVIEAEISVTAVVYSRNTAIQLILRDRSQKKQYKEALKESEERFRILSYAAQDAIIFFDSGGRITFRNRAAEVLFQYESQDITGKSIFFFIPSKKFKHTLEKGLQQARSGDAAVSTGKTLETKAVRRDQSVFPVEVSLSSVLINELPVNIAIIRDITKRKQTESKLTTTVRELRESRTQVEEKIAELSELNEKLQASEKELKELNSGKDKFLSIIAHDLRSPFSSLIGLSQFLAEEIESLTASEISSFAQGILKASTGTYDLLENLLNWSRLQMGRMEFKPEEANLSALIEESLGVFQAQALNKDILLSSDIADNIILQCDTDMIRTVLRNLVSNAIKFTYPGGRVRIKAIKENGYAVVSVSDTGLGIPESDMVKLFRIDKKVSTPGTEDEKGTGLGLLLSKEFLDKHKGIISVESRLNEGSTFTFTLPLEQ